MPLSTKNKKYIYWFASFTALFVILLSVFYNLGGFKEIRTVAAKNISYSIAGKQVHGKLTSKEEHFLFEELKGYLSDGSLKGTLSIVNYKDDTLGEYESRRFVGILLTDEMSMIPAGLTVLELEGQTTFQAALTMHPIVMPNTEKVEAKLQSLAKEKGKTLRPFTLEKLYQDNSVIVEVFAQ
ncbi:hypothetical protein N7E81_03005 [Reichenbachiella carrageenanivorans]|uniref:GyrI-like small molecule binding domain-containing protein n=1 Tax=Reichenbachiella carrageenanivorans TaxID=2979869 RepID=A0ABY6D2T7_9BACT|nr:hypothetical protein [Reichenbachiella carrageenanivorans]UXX80074.1 hypothetical protein N7E81_03005 [Reichenbachiella carrageenanivorans]